MSMGITSQVQIKGLADLLIDIGKIFTGSVIVGFFIPSLGIPFWVFGAGIAIAGLTFYLGISLLGVLE